MELVILSLASLIHVIAQLGIEFGIEGHHPGVNLNCIILIDDVALVICSVTNLFSFSYHILYILECVSLLVIYEVLDLIFLAGNSCFCRCDGILEQSLSLSIYSVLIVLNKIGDFCIELVGIINPPLRAVDIVNTVSCVKNILVVVLILFALEVAQLVSVSIDGVMSFDKVVESGLQCAILDAAEGVESLDSLRECCVCSLVNLKEVIVLSLVCGINVGIIVVLGCLHDSLHSLSNCLPLCLNICILLG